MNNKIKNIKPIFYQNIEEYNNFYASYDNYTHTRLSYILSTPIPPYTNTNLILRQKDQKKDQETQTTFVEKKDMSTQTNQNSDECEEYILIN